MEKDSGKIYRGLEIHDRNNKLTNKIGKHLLIQGKKDRTVKSDLIRIKTQTLAFFICAHLITLFCVVCLFLDVAQKIIMVQLLSFSTFQFLLEFIWSKNKDLAVYYYKSLGNRVFYLGVISVSINSILLQKSDFIIYPLYLLVGIPLLFLAIIIIYINEKPLIRFDNITISTFAYHDVFVDRTDKNNMNYKKQIVILLILFLVALYFDLFTIQTWNIFIVKVALMINIIATLSLLLYFIKTVKTILAIKKWEHENNMNIYCNLKKYYDDENNINSERIKKGLKPIKIKSIFFDGDLEN